MKKTITSLFCALVFAIMGNTLFAETHTIGFEEFASQIGSNHAWNGTSGRDHSSPFPEGIVTNTGTISLGTLDTGYFRSGGATFTTVTVNEEWSDWMQTWDNFGLSTVTDTTYRGFMNEMASKPGKGAAGSETYAVVYQGKSMFPDLPMPTVWLPENASIVSVMITNTVYAYESMLNGDEFVEALNKEIGKYIDLSIHGYDADGELIGTVKQDLGRNTENDGVVILADWTEVDLTSLDRAAYLAFELGSNEMSEYGANYPFYFALDNIVYTTPDATTTPEPCALLILGSFTVAATVLRRRRNSTT